MKKGTLSRKRINNIILQLVLAVLSLLVLVPLFMILINSFKDPGTASQMKLTIPEVWLFDNYKTVFLEGNIIGGYLNSVLIGGLTVCIIITFGCLAAFVIQRRNSKITNIFYYLFVAGLVIPVALVPTIKTMVAVHLKNTYAGMILYYSAILLPFTIFLLTGYLKTIPKELDESAIIDGSGYLRLFFQIIFPIMRPVVITASLIIVINVWNDFIGPFYLLSDSDKWTVTVSVYNYVGKYGTNWSLVFADVIAVITPLLLAYFFLQRHIVDGMTAGAIKG